MQNRTVKYKNIALFALSAVFWLAVWLAGAAVVGSELILPRPAAVFSALLSLLSTWTFWRSVLFSLLRVTAGLTLGVFCAIPLALLTNHTRFSKVASALTAPALTVIRATPVASFILLAFFWLSTGAIPIFISFLMVLPIMWNGAVTGFGAISPDLEEMALVFRIPRARRIRELYLPAAAPAIRSALITSVGLAWKAGIAAEVLCTPKSSIGRGMYEAKIYLETENLFAWTAAVIVLSLVIERTLTMLLRSKRRVKPRVKPYGIGGAK